MENVNRNNHAWDPHAINGGRKPEGKQTGDGKPKEYAVNKEKKARKTITEEYEAPKRVPTYSEKKIMFGLAIEFAVKVIMKKHMYRFNNVTREQPEGGAIGLRATGLIALCVMAYWHREFLRRLKLLRIEMDIYKGFVDDTTLLIQHC